MTPAVCVKTALPQDSLVVQVADRETSLGGESFNCGAHPAPVPVVTEDLPSGHEQYMIVEQVLIDSLCLVAGVDVNEVCPQIGPHQPQGDCRGGKGKRHDPSLVVAEADIGEEPVIYGWETMFALQRPEALRVAHRIPRLRTRYRCRGFVRRCSRLSVHRPSSWRRHPFRCRLR